MNSIQPSIGIVYHRFSYRLNAIIQHHGNDSKSGHYTTLLCSDNKWILCDDTQIVENSKPVNSDGYLYVYERINDSQTQHSLLQGNTDAISITNIALDNNESDTLPTEESSPVVKGKNGKKPSHSSSNKRKHVANIDKSHKQTSPLQDNNDALNIMNISLDHNGSDIHPTEDSSSSVKRKYGKKLSQSSLNKRKYVANSDSSYKKI